MAVDEESLRQEGLQMRVIAAKGGQLDCVRECVWEVIYCYITKRQITLQ